MTGPAAIDTVPTDTVPIEAVGIEAAEIEFATSGSTGEPRRWLRTQRQIEAEAELLVRLLAAHDADAVICYAPPRHLYGYLGGLAIPQLLGIPCVQAGLTVPTADVASGCRRPLIVAVPAAFTVLERSVPAFAAAKRLTLVHSSAVLPPAAPRLLKALGPRARLTELFGSTETGLIATREGGAGDWALAPDVRFAGPAACGRGPRPLRIASPRLAREAGAQRPGEMETGDLVTATGPRKFHWLGRCSRLVKINGVRVNLDAVAARLADAVGGVPFVCIPETDPLRGEWYSIVAQTSDAAALAAFEHAVRALPNTHRPRAVLPSAVVPRAVLPSAAPGPALSSTALPPTAPLEEICP